MNPRQYAKKIFKEHRLNHLILERDYLSERQAVIEAVSPGIAERIGKGYELPDSTYQKIPKLLAIQKKYRDYIHKYYAVEDTLKMLDEDTQKIIDVHYFQGKSIRWILDNADEAGIFYSQSRIYEKIDVALNLLIKRLGLEDCRNSGGKSAEKTA